MGCDIVLASKYGRQIIYEKISLDVGQMLRKLYEYKAEEIIEPEVCKDHVPILVSIPPKYSVAHIRNQLQQDYEEKQLSLKEYVTR